MAAPVAVEAAEQAVRPDHIVYPLQAAPRAFLLNEEHRVVLAGGIVHGDDQIP